MQTEEMKARQRVNTALVAGLGAGVVGALSSVGAELVLNVPFPLLTDTAVSAFLAGLAGALLYAALVRIVRRPVSLLWILTLGIATVDSLLIALLPLPAGQGLQAGTPFDGLIIPIAQLGALLGVGHFGTTHFPAMYLPADTCAPLHPRARGGGARPALGQASQYARDPGSACFGRRPMTPPSALPYLFAGSG
jgi:hypothetical protein